MTNKVDYRTMRDEFEKREEELRQFQNTLGFGTSLLANLHVAYNFNEPIKTYVNWGAIGSVEPKTAIKFAQLINFATVLAKGFKYNGFIVTFGNKEAE